MSKLNERQEEALVALFKEGALPEGQYQMPVWAFFQEGYYEVDGRVLNGLAKQGYITKYQSKVYNGNREWNSYKLTFLGLDIAVEILRNDTYVS